MHPTPESTLPKELQQAPSVTAESLDRPLAASSVQQSEHERGKARYTHAQMVRDLNREFGPAFWKHGSEPAVVLREFHDVKGRLNVVCQCVAWIEIMTQQGAVRREALGTSNARSRGADNAIAYMNAAKGANTNGLRRAAFNLGRRFGSEIAEKDYNELVQTSQAEDQVPLPEEKTVLDAYASRIAAAADEAALAAISQEIGQWVAGRDEASKNRISGSLGPLRKAIKETRRRIEAAAQPQQPQTNGHAPETAQPSPEAQQPTDAFPQHAKDELAEIAGSIGDAASPEQIQEHLAAARNMVDSMALQGPAAPWLARLAKLAAQRAQELPPDAQPGNAAGG